MTGEQFEAEYYPKYRTIITAIARNLVLSNDALMPDLCQEGAIALWQFDLTSVHTNEDACIRTAIARRMIDYIRKERPKLYESLDVRLARGQQLTADSIGDAFLVSIERDRSGFNEHGLRAGRVRSYGGELLEDRYDEESP